MLNQEFFKQQRSVLKEKNNRKVRQDSSQSAQSLIYWYLTLCALRLLWALCG